MISLAGVSPQESTTINLKSNDDQIIPIEISAAKKSALIARLIEDLDLDTGSGAVEIPVKILDAKDLKKVVEYLEEHINDTASDNLEALHKNELSAFDRTFIDIDKQTLVNLYNASNYLDIQNMKNLMGYAIAQTIKGKKYTEIGNFWNVENDHSEDEIREVQKSYEWVIKKT